MDKSRAFYALEVHESARAVLQDAAERDTVRAADRPDPHERLALSVG